VVVEIKNPISLNLPKKIPQRPLPKDSNNNPLRDSNNSPLRDFNNNNLLKDFNLKLKPNLVKLKLPLQ